MIVTVFRSRLMPGFKDEYVALVDRMQQIARTIPGYISHKGFWAEDGERVTIVEFEHEEGQRAWRMHPEHIEAQKLGPAEVLRDVRHQGLQRDATTTISSGKPKPQPGLDRAPSRRHSKDARRAPTWKSSPSWKASPRRCGSSMSTPT